MAVGRLCAQKGFDLLIEVWSKLPADLKKTWHLDIIGDGPDKEKLLDQIHSLKLDDSISIKPPVKNIELEYCNHSIFCFPSRYEGFPLALMEAMSFGLAPISFNCPCGPAELITTDDLGALVPFADINLFYKRLEYMMTNTKLRNETSKNASSNIKENFSLESIMKKWINLFNSSDL